MPPLMGDVNGGPLAGLVGGDPKDKPYKDGSLLHEIFVAQVVPSSRCGARLGAVARRARNELAGFRVSKS
jgi:hypothetical protein